MYEMAMLDVAALEENPSQPGSAWHSAEGRLRGGRRAGHEEIADQADERRLLLRCRLELAVLRFQSRDDKGVTADDRLDLEAELQEVLRLHSPRADRYDAAPLAAPLAEVDELHCMLAQLALGRSDNGDAHGQGPLPSWGAPGPRRGRTPRRGDSSTSATGQKRTERCPGSTRHATTWRNVFNGIMQFIARRAAAGSALSI